MLRARTIANGDVDDTKTKCPEVAISKPHFHMAMILCTCPARPTTLTHAGSFPHHPSAPQRERVRRPQSRSSHISRGHWHHGIGEEPGLILMQR